MGNASKTLGGGFQVYWQKRLLNGTGIAVMDPRRQQPYTVWGNGYIIAFCVTLEEAKKRLANFEERGR